MLGPALAAGSINEDVAHGFGSGAKEMTPPVSLGV